MIESEQFEFNYSIRYKPQEKPINVKIEWKFDNNSVEEHVII